LFEGEKKKEKKRKKIGKKARKKKKKNNFHLIGGDKPRFFSDIPRNLEARLPNNWIVKCNLSVTLIELIDCWI